MGKLREGMKAPAFTLPSSRGDSVSLSEFKGRRVVLYFYPKDQTPGCTVEACEFRDASRTIAAQDAVVLGVSPDRVASHDAFIKKFNLPFVLLSDADHQVSHAYGVWVKKSLYGRTYMGMARTTFVIGPDGRIEKMYEQVKPAGHAAAVAAFLSGEEPLAASARRSHH